MNTANTWRRWAGQNNNHTLVSSYSAPVYRETTFEDNYLETIPEVDSITSKRSSWNTIPPEPPVQIMAPPVQKYHHREPAWSQPSPTIPFDQWGPRHNNADASYSDISPISTPRESCAESSADETCISPIEPLRPFGTQSTVPAPQYQNLIPRKAASKNSHFVGKDETGKEETKWEPYSGEPSAFNVSASAKPDIKPVEQQYPQLKERTKQILAGLREREDAKKPVRGRAPPPVAADSLESAQQKEPWRGASGRTTLVAPVRNTHVAQLSTANMPQRNIGRHDPAVILATRDVSPAHPQHVSIYEKQNPGITLASRNVSPAPFPIDMIYEDYEPRHPTRDEMSSPIGSETTPSAKTEAPALTIRTVASAESINSIKPIAPLKVRSREPTPTHTRYSGSDPSSSPPFLASEAKMLQSPFRSPHPTKLVEEPMPLSSTRTESPHHDGSPITPRTPTPETFHDVKSQPTQQMDHEVSRFSWTTYATTVTESPGSVAHIMRSSSPPPPVPQLSAFRKRPISKYNDTLYATSDDARSQGSIVIRKPVPRKAKPNTTTQMKHLSLSKTLPQLPSEPGSGDKISRYEAQLEALRRRKHNVKRIMRDLNSNLTKNQVNYEARKRKEVEATIRGYEHELQSILNEEHDIGLNMHRAMKKRDRNDCYEQPTGLWVRRVTS